MRPESAPAPAPSPQDHAFVVPAFGESPYLDACLASLKAQTVTSRVVVATSTPSARLAEIAARHGASLSVNPRAGGGIGADWNFALDTAREGGRTRYVTLAHQDDLYRPQFLALTLALFGRRPKGALVFTGADHVDAEGRVRRSRLSRVKALLTGLALGGAETAGPVRRAALLALGNPVHCSSVTFNLQALAGFRFDETLGSNLDWEAWLRLHRQGRLFLYAPERLVARRYHPAAETQAALKDGRRAAEDLAMFQAIWPRPIARAIAFAYRAGY